MHTQVQPRTHCENSLGESCDPHILQVQRRAAARTPLVDSEPNCDQKKQECAQRRRDGRLMTLGFTDRDVGTGGWNFQLGGKSDAARGDGRFSSLLTYSQASWMLFILSRIPESAKNRPPQPHGLHIYTFNFTSSFL
jgi:hypothetical protein